MGKKPELSKELKRSSDKVQKRYIKAYTKSLEKHGDKKKARKKAQKKLEKKYELVGKRYEKIVDKPQVAPKGKDKGKDAVVSSAGKGKKGAEKVKAEKKLNQKKSDKKDSKKLEKVPAQKDSKKAEAKKSKKAGPKKVEPKKTAQKAKKSKKGAAQREAELILAEAATQWDDETDTTGSGVEADPAGEPGAAEQAELIADFEGDDAPTYQQILDAEAIEPGDLEAFEGDISPELETAETITESGASEGLAPEETDEPDAAEELYEGTFASEDLTSFDTDLTTEPLAEAPAQEDAASAPDLQDDDQPFLVAEVRPLAELARAELYELAQQLKVPGRSTMNKGDLLVAVRAAQ